MFNPERVIKTALIERDGKFGVLAYVVPGDGPMPEPIDRILEHEESQLAAVHGEHVAKAMFRSAPNGLDLDGNPLLSPKDQRIADWRSAFEIYVFEAVLREPESAEAAHIQKMEAAKQWGPWVQALRALVVHDDQGQPVLGKQLREEPFVYPASAIKEGLLQRRLMPDGMPDLHPEHDPKECRVTKSRDPVVVARWWWAWHFGDFPHEVVVRVRLGKAKDELPRTED